jgi:hypothetical protein
VTGERSRFPSEHDGWLTAEGAAIRLGVSSNVIAVLFKTGLVPVYITTTNVQRRWCRAVDVDRLRRRLVTRPNAQGRPMTTTEFYLPDRSTREEAPTWTT